jgi:hypothetical protein
MHTPLSIQNAVVSCDISAYFLRQGSLNRVALLYSGNARHTVHGGDEFTGRTRMNKRNVVLLYNVSFEPSILCLFTLMHPSFRFV